MTMKPESSLNETAGDLLVESLMARHAEKNGLPGVAFSKHTCACCSMMC